MIITTKILRSCAVVVTVPCTCGNPAHTQTAEVTFRPAAPSGSPNRWEGLPRYNNPAIRDAAKVAIRKALAA